MFELAPLRRTLRAALRDARDAKERVRVSAVRDLGSLARGADRTEAIAAIQRALETDESEEVRSRAALALADAEADQSMEALLGALDGDGSLRVRQMAMVALGEVAPPEHATVRAAVEAALDEESPAMRFQAIIALGRLVGREVLPAVLRALEDDDAQVRYVALRVADERVGTGEQLPRDLAGRARRALDDEDRSVRLAAALLLARSGDRSGAPSIVEAVNTPPDTYEVEDEEAAIELAGELGLTDAVPGLQRRAWGLFAARRSGFVWQARVALARLGDRRAKEHILRGLRSWTRDSRTLAVAAAGRARIPEAKDVLLAMRADSVRADPEAVEEALALLES